MIKLNNLPAEISPCPIIDANVEVRFSTEFDSEAVFGLIYNLLKDDFPTVEKLPLLQIPEAIRNQDPKLQQKPTHKFLNDSFLVQVGPRSLSVGIGEGRSYPGWSILSGQIEKVFDGIDGLGIGLQIQRLGLRYIDLFESNIFENIVLKVSLDGQPTGAERQLVRLEFSDSDLRYTCQITNGVQVTRGTENLTGSVIDTDVYAEGSLGEQLMKVIPLLNRGHELSKIQFFSLLSPEFLQTLNPTY